MRSRERAGVSDSIGPSYRLVADDLREKISTGKLSVGDPIPSTAQLMKQHGVSSTVVRRAVAQLQAQGVLVGHGGKAVYVQAIPEDSAAGQDNISGLGEQVTELKSTVRGLAGRVDELEAQVMDLRANAGLLPPGCGQEKTAGAR
jgi:DNA-binding GntR family transcriptional regulator